MVRRAVTCTLLLFTLFVSMSTLKAEQSYVAPRISEEADRTAKAARVFREIMNTPDKSIPQSVLDNAECIAVFPTVIKAGFIFGGRGGKGVASCRTGRHWTPPAFFTLGGGSFGLQIGAQATDFILLFMNKNGLNSLLSDKVEMGGDASVAAGPVGRQAGASTDAKFDAQILSYSRSRGLFAGLELKGVVIAQDKDAIKRAYGPNSSAKNVLTGNKVKMPAALKPFPDTLTHYTSRPAQN